MEHRHDDFGGGASLLGMDIHRNATAIIAYRDRAVGMDDDLDLGTVAGQGLVDGVIDHLEHHVV